MQKAGGHPYGLPHIVGTGLQVLFHSPSRGSFHLSLTVLVHYRSSRVFSLGRWASQLPTELACSVVLRIPTSLSLISYTGLSPSSVGLSSAVLLSLRVLLSVLQPRINRSSYGLGFSAFARHYSRNILFSSGYLDVSVLRVPRSMAMCSPLAILAFPRMGFPIRKSTVHCFTTTPRSFSQWYTSFFGLCRLGIHRMPLVA